MNREDFLNMNNRTIGTRSWKALTNVCSVSVAYTESEYIWYRFVYNYTLETVFCRMSIKL